MEQPNKIPELPRLLLIAGTGRHCGKTSLACRIIESLPLSQKPVCIKVSNHFDPQKGSIVLMETTGWRLIEESSASTEKDSSRMLAAGAKRVLFLEAEGANVGLAFSAALEEIDPDAGILVESGGLRHWWKPSLFLIIHRSGTEPKPSSSAWFPLADKILEYPAGALDLPEKPVEFTHGKWSWNHA